MRNQDGNMTLSDIQRDGIMALIGSAHLDLVEVTEVTYQDPTIEPTYIIRLEDLDNASVFGISIQVDRDTCQRLNLVVDRIEGE